MLPLYQVGETDWLTTQTLYHTLAELGEEGIVLCWPKTPYVSIGCHQNWEDYNESSGLPVVRRRVGGSLVYLDRNQVFFQIVMRPERIPNNRTPARWYHYALDPIVRYLQDRGLAGELRLPADILVNGRKISGNAGGQLDDMVVIVGNLLLDFSIESMVTARSGPHQTWHQAFTESMDLHLTTLRECAPQGSWSPELVMSDLAEVFQRHLGAQPQPFPWSKLGPYMERVGMSLTERSWLRASRLKSPDAPYSVKVREGVYLYATRQGNLAHLVAEVDHNEARILRVWGLSEAEQGVSTPVQLRYSEKELETAVLTADVKDLLGQFLAGAKRVPV